MFKWTLLILIGFISLIKGADFLVDGASGIAKKFHISEIVIGLTIVSIGTSMPELFVSISSAIDGYPDMAIGNVIGSNIANLLLILGTATMIKSLSLKKETRLIEIPLCLIVSVVFLVLCNIGIDVSRVDAIILILLFVLFIIYTIIMAFKGEKFDEENKANSQKPKNELSKPSSTTKNIVFLLLGVALLKFGGDLTVNNAVNVANYFKWSEKIISITILSIGTSLPELVTSISAAIKGESDIAIGNILGSNIFNMLLIIGVSALIKPITYNLSYNMDMYILIGATALLSLFPIIPPKNKMSRANRNIIFLIIYCLYYLFVCKVEVNKNLKNK